MTLMGQVLCICKVFFIFRYKYLTLDRASSWGYFDIITLLMLNKASITLPNKKGFTPLDYAYSEEIKSHLIQCAEAIKANKPIKTPKRKDPEVPPPSSNQQATAYVSYLRTIF